MAAEGTINVDRSIDVDTEYNRVGRSPLLEMRHTVDDTLQVATSRAFLSLRAAFHRNGDNMVVFSQLTKEMLTSGRTRERAVVLTDKHLYVVTMPSPAIFAPCAGGSCFSWKEFSRCCGTGAPRNSVLFQFINSVVAVQFGSPVDADRCALAVGSISGAPVERLTELETQDGRHFARDQRRLNLVADPKPRATVPSSAASQDAGSVAQSSLVGKQVLPSKAGSTTASSSQQEPNNVGTIENMLRFILDNEREAQGQGYESLFPSRGVQTEIPKGDSSVQVQPETVDRSTSPIVFAQVDDSDAESNYSDFDHTDVWKSLSSSTSALRRNQRPHSSSVGPGSGRSGGGAGGLGDKSVSFDPNQGLFGVNSLGRTRSSAQLGKSNPLSRNEIGSDEEDSRQGTPAAAFGNQSFAISHDSESESRSEKEPGGSRSDNATTFASWLGVLSMYQPKFAQHGVDSISKLLRLTDKEVENLLDTVDMSKHGHRVLLQSKMAISKQSKSGTQFGRR